MSAVPSFRFELYGCPFEIRNCTPELRDAVAIRLPPINSTESGASRLYNVESAGTGFVVTRARRRLIRVARLEAAADLVVDDIERELARRAAGLIFVHAGVVAWQGHAIVLPGRSGSGKSELTAELVRQGAEYLSDEFAVIDASGRVHPYARPLAFRRDNATERVSPEAIGACVRHDPVRVGRIAFFRYRDTGPWPPPAISAGEAFLGLLRHTLSARFRFEEARPVFHRIASNASAIAGRRCEAEKAAAYLLNVKASLASPRRA